MRQRGNMNTQLRYALIYQVFFNDFLTTEAFAVYLGIPRQKAKKLITIGRAAYNDKFGHN